MTTKPLLTFLLGITFSALSAAGTHFVEVYPVEEGFRVDVFNVERGRLQDFSQGKLFRYEGPARRWARDILSRNSSEAPVLVTTEGRGDPLWKATNAWSEDWEEKYAAWVDSHLTVNFFKDHSIAVDCADVPYALRWIFSRINSLPAFATLGGTGSVVTHEVYREVWKNLPTHKDWDKDKRFLAALEWILDSAFTGTLIKDTFPVEISPSTIKAGLNIHMGSHAEVFSRTSQDPSEVPVTVMSSSVPQAIRVLSARVFMDKKSVSSEKGGLLRFRWPVKTGSSWKVIAAENMPKYSLEQYRKDLCPNQKHFALCVIARAGFTFDGSVVMKRLTKNIEENLAFRSSVVNDGSKFCALNDCTPGTVGWEDWSTPGRDGRLTDLFENTDELSKTLNQVDVFQNWLRSYRTPGRPQDFSLVSFRKNLNRGIISNDPRDSIAARWGETPDAVLESVTSQVRDGEIYRDEAIATAAACRSDVLSCRRNPESLPLYATLDLDLARRRVLTGWTDYCQEVRCPANSLSLAFRRLWTESPAPWDSENDRRGSAALLKTSQVLIADTVSQAFPGTIILDGKNLYDLKSAQIKFSSLALTYDDSSKTLISLASDVVTLYDLNLKPVKTFPSPENAHSLTVLAENRILVLGTSAGNVLDVRERKILLSKSFSSSLAVAGAAILRGTPDVLLSGIEVTNLSALSGKLEALLPVTGKEALVVYSDGDQSRAGFWSQTAFEEVMKADEGLISIESVNKNYVLVKNKTPQRDFQPSLIFDLQKGLWKPEGFFSLGLSPAKDSRIILEADFNSRIPYLFSGKTIRELPFSFNGVDPIISVSSDRIVTLEDGKSRILDFDGKEIGSSTDYANGFCSSLVWRDQCADSRSDLGFSHYLRKNADPDGYLSWMLYSHKSGARAYGIRVYSGESEENSRMLVETGSAMRPYPGILIWNP